MVQINTYENEHGLRVILWAKQKNGNVTYNPVNNEELITVTAKEFNQTFKQI
jgi:hypothetical protein